MPVTSRRARVYVVLAVLQVVLLIASLLAPLATIAAEESPAPAPTEEPSPTPQPTPDPTTTPEATPESTPTGTPEATDEPTADPTATPGPTTTPDPTLAPELRAYVVTFAAGVSSAEQAAALAEAGATDDDSIAPLRMHAVRASDAVADLLRADPRVSSVELDRARAAEAAPSDDHYPGQWSLPQIGWDQAFGSVEPAGSAVVAVLDTGVDAAHPDLDSEIVSGASFVAGSSWDSDPNGHGTAMAGIVAAETDNAWGIAGVGYAGVSVMPVTVLSDAGIGRDSDIIEGVVWATDHGADVILMSFSATGYSNALQAAIDYAWAHDVVLVAAAGNDGSSSPAFPAGDRGVIGVANTDQTDSLHPSSNTGDAVFLAAPGVDIVTLTPGGGTTTITGTSASAAHVAGAAALLAANDEAATNGVIVSRLASTADAAGTQSETGNGRLNLARALDASSIDSVAPAGAAPVATGGPFVGPYVVAAKTLTITIVGTGNVAWTGVADNGNALSGSCSVTCSLQVGNNSSGTLTASAGPGFTFSGWSGQSFPGGGATTCAGALPGCTYAMANRDSAITATFVANQATISGSVLNDLNGNGLADDGGVGIAGATVTLFRDGDADGIFDGAPTDPQVGSAVITPASGAYSFGSLSTGTYFVVETNLASYVSTAAIAGTGAGTTAVVETPDRIRVAIGTAGATSSGNRFLDRLEHDEGTLTVDKTGPATIGHGVTITYQLDVSYAPGADGSPAQNIVVTDDQCSSAVSAPDKSTTVDPQNDSDNLLEVNETWRYTCTYVVPTLHADGEEDPFTNIASVSGQDLDGDAVTGDVSNEVSVNVTHDAGTLSLTKEADVTSAAHGTTITYTLEVTYTAGADGSPVGALSVGDDTCAGLAPTLDLDGVNVGDSDQDERLDGGETWEFTCTYAVPALHTDGEEDPLVNEASVSGSDLDGDALTGDTATHSVNITHTPGTLTIDKQVDADQDGSSDELVDDASDVHGGSVTYRYLASYTPGSDGSPATNVDVGDDVCSSVNVAIDDDGTPTAVDDFIVGDTDKDGRLDSGETWLFVCVFTVPGHDDGEADPIANLATVTGTDLDGDAVTSDTDTASIDIEHDEGTLNLAKSVDADGDGLYDEANGDDGAEIHGGSVTFRFQATYDSSDDAPARNIVLTEPDCVEAFVVASDSDGDDRLDEGETWTWTCIVTVAAHDDLEADPFANQASVDGQDFDGDDLAADQSNVVSVDIEHDPGTLAIVKSSVESAVTHGQTIHYGFDVSYASIDDAPALNVVVTDSVCDSAPAPVLGDNGTPGVPADDESNVGDADEDGRLDEGETWKHTCSHAVGAHLSGEADPLTNTASVDGMDFDGDGLNADASNTVSVDVLHAPVVTISPTTTTVAESGTTEHTFTFSVTDDDPGDTHTIASGYPSCGTTPRTELMAGSATTDGTTGGSFKCRFKDGPDSQTVQIRVVDSTHQPGNVAQSAVTVTNVDPSISITSPADFAQYAIPATVSMVAPFTDPGSLDTHTCSIDWDQPPTVAEGFAAAESGGNGDCNRSHTYTTPGVYTIKVTVTDKDGGTSTATVMVIVYDPNGGFVTGGGWIQSPAGAYTPQDPTDADVTGKANFGFVAKYLKGVATGQTEFQFQAGDLNFHSEEYSSLVVSGYKAQFRGTGTVNGVTGYKFTLTAYDGQVTGGGGVDKFRIRITKNGVVVYDNRYGASEDIDTADPLAISGGSIVIHKGK